MSLDADLILESTKAFEAFQAFVAGSSNHSAALADRFWRDRPREAKTLVAFFNATHSGINQIPARWFTTFAAKVRVALDDVQTFTAGSRSKRSFARKRRFLLAFIAFAIILPMALAPTHPVAVYGYLTSTYLGFLTPTAYAHSNVDIATFLLSAPQIERYREDLLDDMLDNRSGKLFAVVYGPDGNLKQEPIRTWNGFIPVSISSKFGDWFDKKELTFLGDEVELWLRGNTIVAMGHYHPFGGGPSGGDKKAQTVSGLPEIVISNGLAPIVYLDGELVPYARDVPVAEDVFRSLRTVERSLSMEIDEIPLVTDTPSPYLKSYLGYLREYRDVDISCRKCVALETARVCHEFQNHHDAVFEAGFNVSPYVDNQEKYSVVRNVVAIYGWAHLYSLKDDADHATP